MRNNYKVPTDAVKMIHQRRKEFTAIAANYQNAEHSDVERALRWAAQQAEKLSGPSLERP